MIREMRDSDTLAVSQLLKVLYGREEDFILDKLAKDRKSGVRYFVDEKNGSMAGVVSFRIADGVCVGDSLAVAEPGNGCGGALIEYREKFALDSGCEFTELTTASDFYFDLLMKKGYRPVLYQGGFVVMRKRLKPKNS